MQWKTKSRKVSGTKNELNQTIPCSGNTAILQNNLSEINSIVKNLNNVLNDRTGLKVYLNEFGLLLVCRNHHIREESCEFKIRNPSL